MNFEFIFLKECIEARGEFNGTVTGKTTAKVVTSASEKLEINILVRTMSLEILKEMTTKIARIATKKSGNSRTLEAFLRNELAQVSEGSERRNNYRRWKSHSH